MNEKGRQVMFERKHKDREREREKRTQTPRQAGKQPVREKEKHRSTQFLALV